MTTVVCSAVFAVAYLGGTPWLCCGLKLDARALCLAALTCAMTLLLASIMIPLPTGSAITCASWAPVHWAQFFLEHLIAFSALGYAGVFDSKHRNCPYWKGRQKEGRASELC